MLKKSVSNKYFLNNKPSAAQEFFVDCSNVFIFLLFEDTTFLLDQNNSYDKQLILFTKLSLFCLQIKHIVAFFIVIFNWYLGDGESEWVKITNMPTASVDHKKIKTE